MWFPCDYWDSCKKLKKALSSKDRFCNTLTNPAISDKNCKDVLNVWKAFKINTLKYYHDLHLHGDVLLIVCVFETFRNECINSFELDPAYYLLTPGYSWDAMLRFTDVTLKLIWYIENYQFLESTQKVGISMIFKGYIKANNKFLKSYGVDKPTSNIIYLDANNLYGRSMTQLLPTETLDWVNSKDFNLDNYYNDSPIGCFLEAYFDYPDELH